MTNSGFVRLTEAPLPLLTELDNREVALWITEQAAESYAGSAAKLAHLPWSFVLSESNSSDLVSALELAEPIDDLLVRRRGLIHVVDENPAEIILPPRALPVYLLNGRSHERSSSMAALTRRLNMLGVLRRSPPKHLLLLGAPSPNVLQDLTALWDDGLRTIVTVVSDDEGAQAELVRWQSEHSTTPLGFLQQTPRDLADALVRRFVDEREGRVIVRLRDADGGLHRLDITGMDDPEHPILGRYELVTDGTVQPIMPSDLTATDVESFFRDAAKSWRPFAAGMPWQRDEKASARVMATLHGLDRGGPEENRIFFVQSESGAGATTFVRSIAWEAAAKGYPTLVAGAAPFQPNGIEVVAFAGRVIEAADVAGIGENGRLYQAPWLIVFDRAHWEGREDELPSFAREFERSGRRVCIIMVTGPYVGLTILGNRRFTHLVELTHQIRVDEAEALGRHLEPYLKHHGGTRSVGDWRAFFEASAMQASKGIAAFWIALSFWLQRQFDMGETIQSWLYRQYREKIPDPQLRSVVLDIAAMSTVLQPLPEAMLPRSLDWPISDKLADLRAEVGALGLIRVLGERERYWALIHDLLGRFLLIAFYYDAEARKAAGLDEARNPEHLRFLILRRLSKQGILAKADLRDIAESFAVSIFKIDPDHGHATFAPFWREVLEALDDMPRGVRVTSRSFLHHSAISRRRIAKDPELFPIEGDERAKLLRRAVTDIESALQIPSEADGEADINLYNSLAHAYHDLAEAEASIGSSAEIVAGLQAKAQDSTRLAYRLNPDNSFVVETYARTLLSEGRTDPSIAAENAIEVLNIVYSSMVRDSSEARRFALARLADGALDLLLDVAKEVRPSEQPRGPAEAIAAAVSQLARGVARFEGMELGDYPAENRVLAAELLGNEHLRGNAQAVKLRYLLTCLDRPNDFELQLELLQSLRNSDATFTPQMQLELAVLLHQRDRHHEGDQLFRELRRLWKQGDFYVEVPTRLRWLRARDKIDRRQVEAKVTASGDGRYFAKVREFQDLSVVFRPQEFGQDTIRPGVTVRGFVTFGHNGPFLRPLTAS